MAPRPPTPAPRDAPPRRIVVGMCVSGRPRRLRAALVRAEGRGFELRPELLTHVEAELPAELAARFDGAPGESFSPGCTSLLRGRIELAEFQGRILQDLLGRAGAAGVGVLLVGVEDPGVWDGDADGFYAHAPWTDAVRLAEITGLSILDALPGRDLAQGGQGGPLFPLPYWFFLRHPFRTRLLVDLGRTFRVMYLPAGIDRVSTHGLMAFESGPGTALLDLLAAEATEGDEPFDPGGRLAVQGRIRPELVEKWLADPYFDKAPPRWHPHGVDPAPFLTTAHARAAEHDWPVVDLLRTATHFTVEALRLGRIHELPPLPLLDEVLVTGRGALNGLILHELAERFGEIPRTGIEELGFAEGALEPASAAVHALLSLDQVPANLPASTGVAVPRVLGRLTPGTPQNFNRLLHELMDARGVMSLRSAL